MQQALELQLTPSKRGHVRVTLHTNNNGQYDTEEREFSSDQLYVRMEEFVANHLRRACQRLVAASKSL